MLQMCGPTGIGFLYGKSELLSAMPPFLGNADYILLMCKIFHVNVWLYRSYWDSEFAQNFEKTITN